jgi:purine-binding chemotaxis protein CheW
MVEFDGGGARQYVLFHVGAEGFALPLEQVREIIRPPRLVRVPLAPHALSGLANLRGGVLPVADLRAMFGIEARPDDEATRVVVHDSGAVMGLRVDRMRAVANVPAQDVEGAEGLETTIRADLLSGVLRYGPGREMFLILRADELLRREFPAAVRQAAVASAGAGIEDDDAAQNATGNGAGDETALVSFMLGAQEYALPIAQVQEIVTQPETVVKAPRAPSCFPGVVTLRNRLLPLVDLHAMFGLPTGRREQGGKIVVAALGDPAAPVRVGLCADSVREVLRAPNSLIDAVPELLARSGEARDIAAVARLEDGRRIVSILAADRMFDLAEAAAAVGDAGTDAADEDAAMTPDRAAAAVDEEQLVIYRVDGQEYGVPIGAVQEIVRVPETLTRVPKAPAFVEGVVNLRGAVLPVIDNRRRFGLPSAARSERQRIVVFAAEGGGVGFIVDAVSEVKRIPAAAIGPAPQLADAREGLIARVANLEAEKRMVLLVDCAALLGEAQPDAPAAATDAPGLVAAPAAAADAA